MYWLYLDAFGWATLLLAHWWTWRRHHLGGLPWVLGMLWLSTGVMLVNTVAFTLEELWLGHYAILSGVNWPHLVQIGASLTFLVGGALVLAPFLRLPRFDPAWMVGRLVTTNPWRAYAVGNIAVVALGTVIGAAGILGANSVFHLWPAVGGIGSDPYC
jgi:hypothetical protein